MLDAAGLNRADASVAVRCRRAPIGQYPCCSAVLAGTALYLVASRRNPI